MIDVSDGLSSELHHLATASGVAIAIDDVVPAARLSAAAAALGADARHWVLHGGEDHAFLATVPPELTNAATAWTTCIGVVAAGAGVTVAGQPLTARGWDHFRGGA
jgi:thiamine-monophosphate kinase